MGGNYSTVVQDNSGAQPLNPSVIITGSTRSGKSTIMKQILLGSRSGMTMEFRNSFKPVIYKSMLDAAVQMIKAGEGFGIDYDKQCGERIINYNGAIGHTLPASLANDLNLITRNDKWKSYFEFAFNFSTQDNAEYFFKNVSRIVQSDYIPSEEDVLRAYVPTKSVNKVEAYIPKELLEAYPNDVIINIIDAGGSEVERDKWIDHFSEINEVIFCVSLTEYEQMSEEHPNTYQLQESLKIFKNVCNWFENVPILVIFTKEDVFKVKTPFTEFENCFPGFKNADIKEPQGFDPEEEQTSTDPNAERVIKYLKKRFLEEKKSEEQLIRFLTLDAVGSGHKTGEIMNLVVRMMEMKLLETV